MASDGAEHALEERRPERVNLWDRIQRDYAAYHAFPEWDRLTRERLLLKGLFSNLLEDTTIELLQTEGYDFQIIHQWNDVIDKHCPGAVVYVYRQSAIIFWLHLRSVWSSLHLIVQLEINPALGHDEVKKLGPLFEAIINNGMSPHLGLHPDGSGLRQISYEEIKSNP